MNYSELREALLKLKTTEDLKRLFAARNFPTDENIITLNDNGDYAEITSYALDYDSLGTNCSCATQA